MTFFVINGPNLNLLGIREPTIYGTTTYREVMDKMLTHATELGVELVFFHSNHEGDLIDEIQAAYFAEADGIILNAGGYTHTSVALYDALKAVGLPTIELHISNPDAREDFRKQNFIRAACIETIAGQGTDGYLYAIDALLSHLKGK